MNIVISAAGKDWRGTENVTWMMVNGFRRRGHQVLVLCRPGSALQQRLIAANIPHAAVLSGLDLDPISLWRCTRALKRFRADVVITQKDKDIRLSGVAARLVGVPVLVSHVTDRPLKNKPHYRFFFGKVATHHVAVSNAVRDTVVKSAPWLKRDVAVIYNGVDIDEIDAAPPVDLGLGTGAITVGFVGHFEMRKGIMDFAQAWQRVSGEVPNAHAIIVGEGRRAADFHEAMGAAPRVHWLGFRRDVPSIMKALDIFVLPSRFEGFGLVVAEAMAARAAVVAYHTSNMPEIITDGADGILVPPGDVEALAAAVVRLCKDDALRARLASDARETAIRRFSADRMVSDYLEEMGGWREMG
ncbi:MAG TPA: glycosyltransferase family 4 protein [Longimicrobiales bacterium]